MPRVVIFTFKDNVAAEAAIELIDRLQTEEQPQTAQAADVNKLGVVIAAYSKPVAFLARPVRGCTCNRKYTFDKTEVFGWYVCSNCHLPSRHVVRKFLDNLIISGGNNLLQALRDKLRRDRDEAQAAAKEHAEPAADTEATAEPSSPDSEEDPDDRAVRLAEERTPAELEALHDDVHQTAWGDRPDGEE